MNKIGVTILILFSTFSAGCLDDESVGNGNCDAQTKELIDAYGPAEDVFTFNDGSDATVTLYYYSLGFARSFYWGQSFHNCEISDATFTPL